MLMFLTCDIESKFLHVKSDRKAGTRNAGVEKPSRGCGYSSFSITQDLAASDATAYGTNPISPLGPTAEASTSSNASMHVSNKHATYRHTCGFYIATLVA